MKYLTNWQHYLLYGLLIIHGVWIALHLSLVATDAVNPWKLGGYGMYVEPKRPVDLNVHTYDHQAEIYITQGVNDWEFSQANYYFYFYCKPITRESLQLLFANNPDLTGKELKITLHAPEFKAEPLRIDYRQVQELYIEPENDNIFTYYGTVCGEPYGIEQATYPAG